MTGTIVRVGADEDVEALTAIYNHYVLTTPATFDIEPLTVEQRRADWFSQSAATGPHRLLVAVDTSGVLGYATSGPFRPKAAYTTTVSTSVYLAPGTTGRGVGSLLYNELFHALEGQDLHRAMAGITQPEPVISEEAPLVKRAPLERGALSWSSFAR